MKQAIIKKNKYWRGFKKSPTDVILVASLNDTDLIKKYQGCGKGFAIVKKQDDGTWVVTDFLYEEEGEPVPLENEHVVPVSFSCTEVCFTEEYYNAFKFMYYDVKNYSLQAS